MDLSNTYGHTEGDKVRKLNTEVALILRDTCNISRYVINGVATSQIPKRPSQESRNYTRLLSLRDYILQLMKYLYSPE